MCLNDNEFTAKEDTWQLTGWGFIAWSTGHFLEPFLNQQKKLQIPENNHNINHLLVLKRLQFLAARAVTYVFHHDKVRKQTLYCPSIQKGSRSMGKCLVSPPTEQQGD